MRANKQPQQYRSTRGRGRGRAGRAAPYYPSDDDSDPDMPPNRRRGSAIDELRRHLPKKQATRKRRNQDPDDAELDELQSRLAALRDGPSSTGSYCPDAPAPTPMEARVSLVDTGDQKLKPPSAVTARETLTCAIAVNPAAAVRLVEVFKARYRLEFTGTGPEHPTPGYYVENRIALRDIITTVADHQMISPIPMTILLIGVNVAELSTIVQDRVELKDTRWHCVKPCSTPMDDVEAFDSKLAHVELRNEKSNADVKYSVGMPALNAAYHIYSPRITYCNHHPVECKCFVFDLFYSHHSYQYDMRVYCEITAQMTRQFGYLLQHMFEGPHGQYYGEKVWEYGGDGSVTIASNHTDSVKYRCPNNQWLTQRYMHYGDLAVSFVPKPLGSSSVYTFTRVRKLHNWVPPTTFYPIQTAVGDPHHYKQVSTHTPAGEPMYDQAMLDSITNGDFTVSSRFAMFSVPHHLIYDAAQFGRVVTPKALIEAMVNTIGAATLDQDTVNVVYKSLCSLYGPKVRDYNLDRNTDVTIRMAAFQAILRSQSMFGFTQSLRGDFAQLWSRVNAPIGTQIAALRSIIQQRYRNWLQRVPKPAPSVTIVDNRALAYTGVVALILICYAYYRFKRGFSVGIGHSLRPLVSALDHTQRQISRTVRRFVDHAYFTNMVAYRGARNAVSTISAQYEKTMSLAQRNELFNKDSAFVTYMLVRTNECVLTPLVEEYVKRRWPRAGALVFGLESLSKYAVVRKLGASRGESLQFAALNQLYHLIIGLVPYRYGVLLHGVLNLCGAFPYTALTRRVMTSSFIYMGMLPFVPLAFPAIMSLMPLPPPPPLANDCRIRNSKLDVVKSQVQCHAVGFVPAGIAPSVNVNCSAVEVNALKHRMLRRQPARDDRSRSWLCSIAQQFCETFLAAFRNSYVDKGIVPFDDWLDTREYTAAQKNLMRIAKVSLDNGELSVRQIMTATGQLKIEKANLRSLVLVPAADNKQKPGRMIVAFTPAANVIFGPAQLTVKAALKSLRGAAGVVYSPGVSTSQHGRLHYDFHQRVAAETIDGDISKMDAHVHADHYAAYYVLLRWLGAHRVSVYGRSLMWWCKRLERTRGFGRCGSRFKFTYRTASGIVRTTDINTFIVTITLILTMVQRLNCSVADLYYGRSYPLVGPNVHFMPYCSGKSYFIAQNDSYIDGDLLCEQRYGVHPHGFDYNNPVQFINGSKMLLESVMSYIAAGGDRTVMVALHNSHYAPALDQLRRIGAAATYGLLPLSRHARYMKQRVSGFMTKVESSDHSDVVFYDEHESELRAYRREFVDIMARGGCSMYFPRDKHDRIEYLIMVCGDDSNTNVARTLGLRSEDMQGTFTATGLPIKISKEKVTTYVSARFVPCDDAKRRPSERLAPKLGRMIARLGFMCQLPVHTTNQILGLYRGVALGLAPDCSHVPFIRVLIKHILRLTTGSPVLIKRDWMRYFRRHEGSPLSGQNRRSYCTSATWAYFMSVYGLQRSDEQEFDRLMSAIQQLPAVLPPGPWMQAITVDCEDECGNTISVPPLTAYVDLRNQPFTAASLVRPDLPVIRG
jgi:uncharacterized RmlC-like cupin family protein